MLEVNVFQVDTLRLRIYIPFCTPVPPDDPFNVLGPVHLLCLRAIAIKKKTSVLLSQEILIIGNGSVNSLTMG